MQKKGLSKSVILFVSVALGFVACSMILGKKAKLDEEGHYGQILLFLQNKWEIFRGPGDLYPSLAIIPGYHFIMAQWIKLTRLGTPDALRIDQFGLSLMLGFFLYRVSNAISVSGAALRSAQVYFLPILFPFYFLIYTDTLSMVVLMGSFAALLGGKKAISVILATMAIGVRQTNVLWACFMGAYSWVEQYGFTFQKKLIPIYLRSHGGFAVPILAFVGFVVWNGRISLSDPQDHPFGFTWVNISFSLFSLFLLFLPLHLANGKNILKYVRSHIIVALIVIACSVGLALAFKIEHRWNVLEFLVRNKLMFWLTQSLLMRFLLAFCIAGTVLSLIVTPLQRSGAYLLYPCWFLSLIGESLVDFRYYIPAFAFLLVFWERKNAWIETLLWVYLILLAMGIHFLHVQTKLVL